MKFDGFAELEAALRELGDNGAIKRSISKSLMIAAEPAAKEARARAPRRTGGLAEGIDVSTTLSRRQKAAGDSTRFSGLRGKADPYAVFVYIGAHPMGPAVIEEFGTTQRSWKNGKSTGSAPAHPFMRPAWENHKFQILADFAKYLWVTIEAEAKRIARKQARLIAKTRSGA